MTRKPKPDATELQLCDNSVVLTGQAAECYARLGRAEVELHRVAGEYEKARTEHEAALLMVRAMARKSGGGEG